MGDKARGLEVSPPLSWWRWGRLGAQGSLRGENGQWEGPGGPVGRALRKETDHPPLRTWRVDLRPTSNGVSGGRLARGDRVSVVVERKEGSGGRRGLPVHSAPLSAASPPGPNSHKF